MPPLTAAIGTAFIFIIIPGGLVLLWVGLAGVDLTGTNK